MDEGIRLQRYLSQCGIAARRKAEELIESGAVTVNGQRVTELGTKVVPGQDRVAVNGETVYPEELFYVLLNKPKGCLTAVSDPENRPTVMEYLPNVPVHVAPVGRLDFYSEGVLLLTNDGELSARLQSPKHHIEKTYHVKVHGRVTPRHLEALRLGIRLEDGTVTRPAQVDLLTGTKSKHDWLVITLIEGKSRQIHRMVGALGYQVMKLQRVAYGGLNYHGLRVGDARELTQVEVNSLREVVGLPKDTVARGKWSARREDTELSRRALARTRTRTAARSSDEPREGWSRPPRGQAGATPRPRGPARDSRPGGFGEGSRPRGPARDSRPGGFGEGSRPRGPARDSRPGGFGEGSRPRGPARDSRPGGFGEGSRPRGPARGPRPGGFGEDSRSRGPARGPRPGGFGEDSRSRGPARGPRPGGFGEDSRPRGPARGPRPGGFGEDSRSRGPARGPRPGGFGEDSRPRGPARGPRPGGFGEGSRPRGPARPRPEGFGEGSRPRGPARPRPEGFGEGSRPRGPGRGPRPEGFGEGTRSRGPDRAKSPQGRGPQRPGKPRSPRGS
jgi:23S rRNA pseudouridine2605 synthase